jgi:hypothetical protein
MTKTSQIFKLMTRSATACALGLALLGAQTGALAASVAGKPMSSSMTPAAQTAAGASLQMQGGTLTSIHQVEYTDQGVETWIQVQGTGNCTFTIESAGVAPQSFASTAAKPFPIKVKIAGAPLGSHFWTAKGTGKCTGSASTTFSVNG